MDNLFKTPIQEFQFIDKYARFNNELGRRENWAETVDRVVDFLRYLADDKLPEEMWNKIYSAIYSGDVMPSMRLVAMAGPAAKRNNAVIYNCSYLPIDSVSSWSEMLSICMGGTGVGYSVERKYVSQLPTIRNQTGYIRRDHVIEDSSEGWVKALKLGLDCWFNGDDMNFDYSQIRPHGAILRTKGGRASGPEPLKKLLDYARDIILSRQGEKLSPLDCHDISTMLGDCVVQGGVRRSALICLFDADDEEMISCKDPDKIVGNYHRYNANNSAVWNRAMSREEISAQMYAMNNGGNGEPGIFSRLSAERNRPYGRRNAEFGTNPCLTGDTWILTDSGPQQIRDLVNKEFGVPYTNGSVYKSTGFWQTGVKDVYVLRTAEGYNLRLTSNHRVMTEDGWKEAGDLEAGDRINLFGAILPEWDGSGGTMPEGYLLGYLVGDGTFGDRDARYQLYDDREDAQRILTSFMLQSGIDDYSIYDQAVHHRDGSIQERTVVSSVKLAELASKYGIVRGEKGGNLTLVEKSSSDFYRGFLMGLADSDGSVQGCLEKGRSVRYHQSDKGLLIAVQRMLLRFGIYSRLYANRKPAEKKEIRGQVYSCKATHELVISRDSFRKFGYSVGFVLNRKKSRYNLLLNGGSREFYKDKSYVTFTELAHSGREPVYDATVDVVHSFDANGLWAHNCGEIILRPRQFCNLTTAVARVDDTVETLQEKIAVATWIGTIQSSATYFPELPEEWRKNCEEERLLGVDINGQMDCPLFTEDKIYAEAILFSLKLRARIENTKVANMLDINESAAITCTKPSGNSSTLLDCSPGLHPRHSQYYIRRVRVPKASSMYWVLYMQGMELKPENGQEEMESPTMYVASFPVKSPDGAVLKGDRGAIEQLEYWRMVATEYTEHNPSCTITYHQDELEDMIDWIHRHQLDVNGLSFLPASDIMYEQAPYEEISKEQYEQMIAEMPNIDFSMINIFDGGDDNTTVAQELACFAGSCEII